MFWNTVRWPLDDDRRRWVDARLAWLVAEFGHRELLRHGTVVATDAYFPEPYYPDPEGAEGLVARVSWFMGAQRSQFELQYYGEDEDRTAAMLPYYEGSSHGASGLYFQAEGDEKPVLAIAEHLLEKPNSLTATLAHELAHLRLLGGRHMTGDEDDHEEVTDLMTAFRGLGAIVSANAFVFSQWQDNRMAGWSAARNGYLDEHTWGYAIAAVCWLSGTAMAGWDGHLTPSVRKHMRAARTLLDQGKASDTLQLARAARKPNRS